MLTTQPLHFSPAYDDALYASYLIMKEEVSLPPGTHTVWWQNMSRFHPIRTCFLVMCTRLDATEGIISCKITNELSSEPTKSPIKHYNNKIIVIPFVGSSNGFSFFPSHSSQHGCTKWCHRHILIVFHWALSINSWHYSSLLWKGWIM